jgi:hypothetical protein
LARKGNMPEDSPTSNGPVVADTRTFLKRLRVFFSRARVLVVTLGAIFLGLGAYVSSLSTVRSELCRDGIRWACSRLSCSQPVLLDAHAGTLTTTISNPTDYSANILNATLNINAGSELLSIPLEGAAEEVGLPKDCASNSSLISAIELKSKSATTIELRPIDQDCGLKGDLVCDTRPPIEATANNYQLTLHVRDGLGSEYPLDIRFPCSGLTLKKCGKGQDQLPPTRMHTNSPSRTSKTNNQDMMSPSVEEVRKDVSRYYLTEATVVSEKDISPEAPRYCGPDANHNGCSVRVEVTTQDVSGLRHCKAQFAVYRYNHNTWKLDDLTDAGKCNR